MGGDSEKHKKTQKLKQQKRILWKILSEFWVSTSNDSQCRPSLVENDEWKLRMRWNFKGNHVEHAIRKKRVREVFSRNSFRVFMQKIAWTFLEHLKPNNELWAMLNIVNPNSNAMFNTRAKASSLSSEMKYSSSLKLISEFSQRDRVVQRVLFFFNFLFKFRFTLHNARVQNARKFPARCQCSSL